MPLEMLPLNERPIFSAFHGPNAYLGRQGPSSYLGRRKAVPGINGKVVCESAGRGQRPASSRSRLFSKLRADLQKSK